MARSGPRPSPPGSCLFQGISHRFKEWPIAHLFIRLILFSGNVQIIFDKGLYVYVELIVIECQLCNRLWLALHIFYLCKISQPSRMVDIVTPNLEKLNYLPKVTPVLRINGLNCLIPKPKFFTLPHAASHIWYDFNLPISLWNAEQIRSLLYRLSFKEGLGAVCEIIS